MAIIEPSKLPDASNDEALSQIGAEGEQRAYELMREQAPDSWVILRNITSSAMMEKYGIEVSRELDALILIPHVGLVGVEIKRWTRGGVVDGVWYRRVEERNGVLVGNEEDRATAPDQQAIGALINTVKFLRQNKIIKYNVSYRELVILVADIIGLDSPENENIRDKYLTLDEMRKRPKLFVQRVEFFFRGRRSQDERPLQPETLENIRSFLAPTLQMKISHATYLDALYRKSATILNILRLLEYSKGNILVQGCAGSGKTLMLKNEVERLCERDSNKKLLVLCFNRNLAHLLHGEFEKYGNVRVNTFHGYIKSICRDYYDSKEISSHAIQIAKSINWKYDYIFFDEAQDMQKGWSLIVQKSLVPDTGKVYYFADSNQDINNNTAYPTCPTVINLGDNIRNCKRIASFSNELLPPTITKPDTLDIPGHRVTVLPPEPNRDKRAQLVREILEDLKEQGVRKKDIAVLSPWASSNPQLQCSFPVLEDVVSYAPEGESPEECNDRHDACLYDKKCKILGDTVRAFKGLERVSIILTDVIEPQQPRPSGDDYAFTENELYVACTRARYSLHIIPVDDKAYNYLQKKLTVLKQ